MAKRVNAWDEVEKLYEVADDFEAGVLDTLRHKAGLLWTCEGPHAAGKPSLWTNQAGKPCDVCGRKQAQS